jgi:hypothetical protein
MANFLSLLRISAYVQQEPGFFGEFTDSYADHQPEIWQFLVIIGTPQTAMVLYKQHTILICRYGMVPTYKIIYFFVDVPHQS